MQKYTFFVDESGDLGLDRVRQGPNDRGASPFLTLGGCLIPLGKQAPLRERLSKLSKCTFNGKHLHCSELNHFQVAKFAREIASTNNILLFALASKKGTLGDYGDAIRGKGQDQQYYNKCASYLLERLGHCLQLNKISKDAVSVVFEDRKANFQKLRNYIKQIQTTPFDTGNSSGNASKRHLNRIDYLSITSKSKEQEPLLSIADLVAYSARQAFESTNYNYGIPEQRYLRELKGRFFNDPNSGAILNWGVKVIKIREMGLDRNTQRFIQKMRVGSTGAKV